jgi:hypothetical protein
VLKSARLIPHHRGELAIGRSASQLPQILTVFILVSWDLKSYFRWRPVRARRTISRCVKALPRGLAQRSIFGNRMNLSESSPLADTSDAHGGFVFESVINQICRMPWEKISNHEVFKIAKAYYYFSVQFRENLAIACLLYPRDENLRRLHKEECHTDNLSPFPGITAVGEKINHDEFIGRLLRLQPSQQECPLEMAGMSYLRQIRQIDDSIRAASIASYEDGGLSNVFSAILRAPHWQGAGQQAFRFFLEEHIRFDSDADGGHGALSRHLKRDDDILPLWTAFKELLITAAPVLAEIPSDIGNARCDPEFDQVPLSSKSAAR